MNDKTYENLLRSAFREKAITPESWADKTRASMHERAGRPRRMWSGKRLIVLVIILALVVPVGVYAGFKLLSPGDAALLMNREELAEAFDQQKTKIVTRTDGDYTVSLLGIVSGTQLDEFGFSAETGKNQTYAALAVQRTDGMPIEGYGNPNISVSPVIEGLDPALWNTAVFDNAWEKRIVDGVLYCIADWKDMQMFGYRKMYIAVMEDTFVPSRELFAFDDKTGAITENETYDKVNLLFEIEADKSKADRQAAEKWIAEKEAEYMQGEDDAARDPHIQEITKNGITFKIKDGMLRGKGDDDAVYALNFFVKGEGIKSVQLATNTGGVLQPELITKAEYERISAEWEKQKEVTAGRSSLHCSQGLYLFSDYDRVKKSIKVDYNRFSEHLYGEEALELVVTRAAPGPTELKIIVTKKDGSTVTEKVRCSGTREINGFEYIIYNLQ